MNKWAQDAVSFHCGIRIEIIYIDWTFPSHSMKENIHWWNAVKIREVTNVHCYGWSFLVRWTVGRCVWNSCLKSPRGIALRAKPVDNRSIDSFSRWLKAFNNVFCLLINWLWGMCFYIPYFSHWSSGRILKSVNIYIEMTHLKVMLPLCRFLMKFKNKYYIEGNIKTVEWKPLSFHIYCTLYTFKLNDRTSFVFYVIQF